MKTGRTPEESTESRRWEDTRLPFRSFIQLQKAVADKQYNLGVDSLAAARWCQEYGSLSSRLTITSLSLLIVMAGLASIVVALIVENYWLLAAAPIQAGVFYVSHSGYSGRKWVTVAGVMSPVIFINLLLNHLTTAAVLMAYAILTFAAVRLAGYIANSAFRRRLVTDEDLFLDAYSGGWCKLMEKSGGRVYGAV